MRQGGSFSQLFFSISLFYLSCGMSAGIVMPASIQFEAYAYVSTTKTSSRFTQKMYICVSMHLSSFWIARYRILHSNDERPLWKRSSVNSKEASVSRENVSHWIFYRMNFPRPMRSRWNGSTIRTFHDVRTQNGRLKVFNRNEFSIVIK